MLATFTFIVGAVVGFVVAFFVIKKNPKLLGSIEDLEAIIEKLKEMKK